MSLGDSIRNATQWLLFGNVGGRFLQFAIGVALARLLVPADFGILLTVHVFTGFVSMLTSGGMGQSLIRAKTVGNEDFDVVFTYQLGLGILAYLGFFFAAPLIADLFDNPIYTDLVRVSAVIYLLRPLSMVRNAWLNREMAFKVRAIVTLVTLVISGISSVAMAWSGFGVWSLVFSGLIGAFASNFLLAIYTPLRLKLDTRLSVVRRHGAFGMKIVVNDFLDYCTVESKKLIMSKLAGPGFLGLFNKGESLARMPGAIAMPSVMQPIFRALSTIQDDLNQTKYLYYRVITLLGAYLFPVYCGVWWVAEPFIGFVYGDNWLPAAEPLRILVLAGILRTVYVPSCRLLQVQNRMTRLMFANFAVLAIVILVTYLGLNWGLPGVAWGLLGAGVFSASLVYYFVYQLLPTRIGDLVGALMPGLLLGGLVFATLASVHFFLEGMQMTNPGLYLCIMALTGAIAYAAAFLFIPIPALRTEAARWRGLMATYRFRNSSV